MPVIVIGADTEYGEAVATALTGRNGEVRAFVTDPGSAPPLRQLGIKVAVGDISDASHIEGAARGAFSAVAIAQAGLDDRERAFAHSYDDLVDAWARGLRDAGVKRVLWVGAENRAPAAIAAGVESGAINTRRCSPSEAAIEAVRLDDLAELEP